MKIKLELTLPQAVAILSIAGEGLAADWTSLKDYVPSGYAGIRAAQRALAQLAGLVASAQGKIGNAPG